MSRRQQIAWLVAGAVLTALFLTPIFLSDYNRYVAELVGEHPTLAPAMIIAFRFLGIVIAPLPGAAAAFASMAFLPWPEAWAYNLIGVELGSACAFWIARKWREPIAAKFAPLKELHVWQEKISEKRQFWGFVALRFMSSIMVDFLSYAAGLSKISFRNFLMASASVDGVVSLALFYLGNKAFAYGVYFGAVFLVLFGILFIIAKYFKKQ